MAALRIVHRYYRRQIRRERIFRDRTNPLDHFNDEELRERYRFPRREILDITDEVIEELTFRFNRQGALPPALQVCIALRFYASGSFQQVMGDVFGVDKCTARRVIHRVSTALDNIFDRHVHFDPQAQADLAKIKFWEKAQFPNVIACVDGTHVKIIAPIDHEQEYVNRKGYHSINVQLICDADLKILNAVIRWPGSVHDARMLRESEVFRHFEDQPPPLDGFILGDSGYMLRPWLMTPYLNPRNVAQEAFNQAHSITRSTIERCNGVLKRRWHCLHGELRYAPQRASRIIAACVVLHNKAVQMGIPLPNVNQCDDHCIINDHNEDPFVEQHQHAAALENPRATRDMDARLVRDQLVARHFQR